MILSILKFLFHKTMFDYSMEEFGRGFQTGWEWGTNSKWPYDQGCYALFAKLNEAIDNAATEGK